MIDFHAPELSDKPRFDAAFLSGNCQSDDYCFGNLYIWHGYYKTRVAYWGDLPLIAFDDGPHGAARYLFPIGKGDVKGAIRALSQEPDARRPFTLAGVTEKMKEQIEELFPECFTFQLERAFSDYIYRVEDLVNLSGRKYHGKRNHLARFKRKEWHLDAITSQNLDVCAKMNDEWCKANDVEHTLALQVERDAVHEAFAHYEELGFTGGLLWQEDRPVAFTLGEAVDQDTYDVHIEKAFADVEGAYTAINREFLAAYCMEYTYVNREEDVGDEGLRKAKLSYHPVKLLDKYTATLKEGKTL